jgi:hypothetical protein
MRTSRIWKVRFSIILAGYVGLYTIAYSMRPKFAAANLAYFVYTGSLNDAVEKTVYYFFWPSYKFHRLMGGQCHNLDRTKTINVEDF